MAEMPKRNRSKDNPYHLSYDEERNTYIVEFTDNKNITHKVEISNEVYIALDVFELEDISQIHKYRKHIEHSEVYEESLNKIAIRINSFGNANDCYLTNFSLFKDIEAYSFSYDENGNLISTVDLNKAKSTMKYNKNNQLLDAMTPMGANYSFEYDKKIMDRVINSTSPTGINNRIVYDSFNNPIKTIISNRKTNSNLEYNIPYFIRAIGTNKYLFINDDKSLKIKDCDCSIEKFNLVLSGSNVKIQNTILNNYYIKVRNNNITLEYGDNDNLFTIVRNDNNSYTIKQGNNAITINDSNNIVLSPY